MCYVVMMVYENKPEYLMPNYSQKLNSKWDFHSHDGRIDSFDFPQEKWVFQSLNIKYNTG